MKRIHTLLVFILLFHIFLFIPSCAPRKTKTTIDRVYELDPRGGLYISPQMELEPPRILAVLPFRSHVGEGKVQGSQSLLLGLRGKEKPDSEALAQEMRLAFFGQLSQLPYEEVHPTRIDARLKAKGVMSWDALKALTPKQMRTILDVDAVIFGEITHFDYVYAFLYSQLAVGLKLQMISTHNGEVLWRFDDTRRDHTVRVALDPISLVVGLFQAGFSLRAINMTRAMDEVCREAVAHLPYYFKQN